MAAKTLDTATTATSETTEATTTDQSALALFEQAADDLAKLRAEFEEFKAEVEHALSSFRGTSPDEFAALTATVDRLRARVLPND